MEKELHIWMEQNNENNLLTNFQETQKALIDSVDLIHTTQPHFCNTKWITKYKIFVHMLDNECVEILLGTKNKYTNRNIRLSHNLEKLLLANEFGYATINN